MGKGATIHQVLRPPEGFPGKASVPFQPTIYSMSQTVQVISFFLFLGRRLGRAHHERRRRQSSGMDRVRTREKDCHNNQGKP